MTKTSYGHQAESTFKHVQNVQIQVILSILLIWAFALHSYIL